MSGMALDGLGWILLLIVMLNSWMLFNAAVWLIGRCKRFSLRGLLVLMTLIAVALGLVPTIVTRAPELAVFCVALVFDLMVVCWIIRHVNYR
jgi:hypothetical protein